MIAHRLSTLADCDVRLQIEGGRVIGFEQQHNMREGAGSSTTKSLYRSKEIP
jgi:ABC-type multidrug transport system fused ATPase/permease subunit